MDITFTHLCSFGLRVKHLCKVLQLSNILRGTLWWIIATKTLPMKSQWNMYLTSIFVSRNICAGFLSFCWLQGFSWSIWSRRPGCPPALAWGRCCTHVCVPMLWSLYIKPSNWTGWSQTMRSVPYELSGSAVVQHTASLDLQLPTHM
jgi:hypothetical protein